MRTVYAGDYGILPEGAKARQCGDEAERTLTERFRKMTAENPRDTRFVLEPGTYHFYPADAVKRAVSVSNSDQAGTRSFGVFLEDLEHVCLEGQDAVFCFHGDMMPLAVSGCRHIEVKNLKITSAMPHSAEARVLRASEEAVEIGIDSGKFPCCIEDEKLYFLQEGEKLPGGAEAGKSSGTATWETGASGNAGAAFGGRSGGKCDGIPDGGQITIENCRFRGLMDDPVNVHGTAAGIREISGDKRVTGVYCHPQSTGFDRWASPEDVIAFLRPEDRSLVGMARAVSYRLITPTEFDLELADKIPEGADENCSLENLSNTPSVLCRNNYFGSCRAEMGHCGADGRAV